MVDRLPPLNLRFDVENPGTQKLQVIDKELQKLGINLDIFVHNTQKADRASQQFSGGLSKIIGPALAVGSAIAAAALSFVSLREAMAAVERSGALEDKVRAVAAMITVTTGDFGRAMVSARGYVDALVGDAKRLPGEFQDFMGVTQAIAGPLLAQGAALKDIRSTVGDIAIAASIYGQNIETAGTDVMRMLQGAAGIREEMWRILSANTRVLKGMDSQRFNALDVHQRYRLINAALKEIAGNQELLNSVAKGWTTQTSTLKDNIYGVKGFMGGIGDTLKDAILPRLIRLNEAFERNGPVIDRISKAIGGVMADALIRMEAPAKALLQSIVSLGDYLAKHRGDADAFMDKIIPSPKKVAETFKAIAKGAVLATVTVANLVNGMTLLFGKIQDIGAHVAKVQEKNFVKRIENFKESMKAIDEQRVAVEKRMQEIRDAGHWTNTDSVTGARLVGADPREVDRIEATLRRLAKARQENLNWYGLDEKDVANYEQSLQNLRHAEDSALEAHKAWVAQWANGEKNLINPFALFADIDAAFAQFSKDLDTDASLASIAQKAQAAWAAAHDTITRGADAAREASARAFAQGERGFAVLSAAATAAWVSMSTGPIGANAAAEVTEKALNRIGAATVTAHGRIRTGAIASMQAWRDVSRSVDEALAKVSKARMQNYEAALKQAEADLQAQMAHQAAMDKYSGGGLESDQERNIRGLERDLALNLRILDAKKNIAQEMARSTNLEEQKRGIEDVTALTNRRIEVEQELTAAINDQNRQLKEANNLWAGMGAGLRDWTKEAQKAGKQAGDAITGLLTQSIDGLSNSISRAIVYSENLGESLRNVAMESVAYLIKMAIQMAITAAIAAILASLIPGAGPAAAGNAIAAGGSVASATAGMQNAGNTMHAGGPVYPGRRVRPDEVNVTLQTGEYDVLSRRDVEELKRSMVGNAGTPTAMPGGPQTERIIILPEEEIARAYGSPGFRDKIQRAAVQ